VRRLIVLVSVAAMTLLGLVAGGGSAQAKVPGPNGQIVFTRYDPATDESYVFTANPDGTHEHQLLPDGAGLPYWSPDGSQILLTICCPARPAIINADGSGFKLLDVPGLPPDADMGCRAWSPDSTRLLCQVIRFEGDTSLNGIYTIHSSDGGDLTRLTVSSYPPQGESGGATSPVTTRRMEASSSSCGRSREPIQTPVTSEAPCSWRTPTERACVRSPPYGLPNSHDNADESWSPDGSAILFASEHGLLFVVHPDGTGVRRIPLHPGGGFSFAFTPGWSPDGTRIVFSLFLRKTGQVDLYTARPDGRDLVKVTDTPNFEDFPDWGPHPLAT